jgi:hypothetical protein
VSGLTGNGDLGQVLHGNVSSVTNCIDSGYIHQGLYGYQPSPRSTLDVAYFLKHASEAVLVEMHKRIPEELKARVEAARGREREAQEAYEKVLDCRDSEAPK